MKFEIYTLDEAARAMWTEPDRELHYPGNADTIAKVCRTLAEIVKAIRASDLDIVRLPDNILHKPGRAMMIGEYLDALAHPEDGGEAITFDNDERDLLIASGIKRQPLIDFAKLHRYDAPSLPGAAARQLAHQRHEQANAPYDDAVSVAVTIWDSGEKWKHNEMRDFLIEKPDYHDLDPGTLLRKLKDAANSHGWPHLVYGTDKQRIHDHRSGF